ncbi:MAG TPA: ABC transporter substrate-binding protein [Candidatus Limnocylindria bacterium]|jgi:branched-chain amino acid transport system substrate-binding protein
MANRIVIATALAVVAFTAACAANAPPSPAPAPAAAKAPLRIGILVPFTESAIDADIGASQRRAADLYLKLKGGALAGRQVQLVYNDESALDPKVNEVRIRQFLADDHVELLLGGAGTPAAYLLRDSAEAAKLVYIDTNASGNTVTRTPPNCASQCQSKLVFRTAPSSWQMSEPLGEWAAKNGRREFAVVYGDDVFGTESAAAFVEGLTKNGGTSSVGTAVPTKSGADWAKIVAGLKSQAAKNVFAAFVTDDAEGFINAWGSAGMSTAGYRLFGPGPLVEARVVAVTKQAALGITTSFPWSAELDNPENRSFVKDFSAAYKDDETGSPLVPDAYAVEMWDTMQLLENALKATDADVKDSGALVAALEGASFRGPGGAFALDRSTHDPLQDMYIREVKAANGTLVNAVVDKIANVTGPGQ